LKGIGSQEALRLTTEYHNKRAEMKEKWYSLGSPNCVRQRRFVIKFFEPIYFYKSYKKACTNGFSNFSQHNVRIPTLGLFPTSEAAFQAFKNVDDYWYVEKQKNAKTPLISKRLGESCVERREWKLLQTSIMEKVLKCKIEQNDEVHDNLIATGFRKIIHVNKNDSFWGVGLDGHGKNMLGVLLEKVRIEIYERICLKNRIIIHKPVENKEFNRQ
jgi:ribA/ribD-fused uncharacterized protein